MSTGYTDKYTQHPNSKWTYVIDAGDYLDYDSEKMGEWFNTLTDAEDHCSSNHANSGTSYAIGYIDKDWDLNKRDDVLHALTYWGGNIIKASLELRDDENLVRYSVREDGDNLMFASDRLKDNEDVVLAAYSTWLNRQKQLHMNRYSEQWLMINPSDRKFKYDPRDTSWSPIKFASKRVQMLLGDDPLDMCK